MQQSCQDDNPVIWVRWSYDEQRGWSLLTTMCPLKDYHVILYHNDDNGRYDKETVWISIHQLEPLIWLEHTFMIWILRCPSPALHKSMPSRHSSQNCNSKKNTKGTYMVGAISTRYSYKASRNFRLIPAKDYLREFASDRSHMVSIATFGIIRCALFSPIKAYWWYICISSTTISTNWNKRSVSKTMRTILREIWQRIL